MTGPWYRPEYRRSVCVGGGAGPRLSRADGSLANLTQPATPSAVSSQRRLGWPSLSSVTAIVRTSSGAPCSSIFNVLASIGSALWLPANGWLRRGGPRSNGLKSMSGS